MKTTILVAMALSLSWVAWGQDSSEEKPERAKKASNKPTTPNPAKGFFKKKLNFWEEPTGEAPNSEENPPPRKETVEAMWGEHMRMPDGSYSVRLPAPHVLALLVNPSRENAERYLKVMREKMESIARAMEAVRKAGKEKERSDNTPAGDGSGEKQPAQNKVKEASPQTPDDSPSPATRPTSEILYFKRDDCPYCTAQDKVMRQVLKERKEITLTVLGPPDKPELWKSHGVSTVPTLIIRRADGQEHVLRGYTPKEALLQVLSPGSGGEK